MFKIGANVIFRGNDNQTLDPVIKRGTITKLGKDTVWLDNAHKPEDQVYTAYLFPDIPECVKLLQDGIDMDLRHKKEKDDYMTDLFKMNNHLIRTGQR